ncbi:hypothetical protein PPERSA_02522 [Pseudocohnilembus persalinus]|uniref:Uncharacterized protein n=1 Tax=Pseudocohnilembus persalinus TaxID=266149 RepID=A0A0V0QB43_PSEPJ|nr:hypothetical protein PPERSA_02522 [Pseudocohnilembus persalinus]|eukprot:KRW99410.1 hypothetical protein PPERSA_02522 [Pseudocohnilembus persalinus]
MMIQLHNIQFQIILFDLVQLENDYNNQNFGADPNSSIQQLNPLNIKTPQIFLNQQQQNNLALKTPQINGAQYKKLKKNKKNFETYKGTSQEKALPQQTKKNKNNNFFFLKVGAFSLQNNYQIIAIEDDEKVLRDLGLEKKFNNQTFITQTLSTHLMQQMDLLIDSQTQQQTVYLSPANYSYYQGEMIHHYGNL